MACIFLGQDIPGYGQTALASDLFNTPISAADTAFGNQSIDQFASDSAAWSFLTQEAARFQSRACHTQANTNQGTTFTTVFERLDWTKIGGYPAIDVAQSETTAGDLGSGPATYNEITVVNAGTNVYSIMEFDRRTPTYPLRC
jgi:hypothetical protein